MKFKKILSFIPEMLLMAGAVFGILAELIAISEINYFMVVCLAVMGVLVFWKNKYLALVISVLLGLVSMYFMLALFSEFKEFPAGSKEGMTMLMTGMSIFGSLMILSVIMPVKYFIRKYPVNENAQ